MKRMVESEIADILNEKLQVNQDGVTLKDNLIVDGLAIKEQADDTLGFVENEGFGLDLDITETIDGAIAETFAGLMCHYAHIRVSNGKLNFIAAFNFYSAASVSMWDNGTPISNLSISIPHSIYLKLWSFTNGVVSNTTAGRLDTKTAYFVDYLGQGAADPNGYGMLLCALSKGDSDNLVLTLRFKSGTNAIVTNNSSSRFEFNYILS